MFGAKDHNKLKRLLSTQTVEKAAKIPKLSRSEQLAAKSRTRLSFARFRALNEFLYSHSSSEATAYLSAELFANYHKTYEEIAAKWPKRPVDYVIERLKSREVEGLTIADIGCGNRPQIKLAFPALVVHSFDLIAEHKDIRVADMTLLPLENKSVDVCVYCLSLMATNLSECLREANRVLKTNGSLIVAEVKSRFDPSEEQFARQLRSLGFSLVDSNDVTDFFVVLEFRKNKDIKSSRLPTIALKPCFYKLR